MQDLLRDLTIVLAASLPILFLFRKLRLPAIVGFLATGALIGPHALSFLRDTEHVEAMADFGVVLILFFVGLEFPLARLGRLAKTTTLAGALQMGLCAGGLAVALHALGEAWGAAVFAGLLVSLSSTAVVLPALAERDELAAPHGHRFLAVSLFQDLALVPLLLVLPALAPASTAGAVGPAGVVRHVAVALGGVTLLAAAARFVVPWLLDRVARLGSREGFTGAVLVLVLVLVSLSAHAGVSPAMGAFVAGIVLAESEYLHEVVAALAPFRELLSCVFFVSIGMLLDPRLVVERPALVLLAVTLVLVWKTATAFAALRLAATAPRTAARAALALAGVGEFSFVLAKAGRPLGLLAPEREELFVAIAVATLALAPLLVAVSSRVAAVLPDIPDSEPEGESAPPLARHVVVAGYGLNGQNVARVLLVTHIPHVVLDVDVDRVARARAAGSRAIRADATSAESLAAAGIERALALVVATSDPDATRRAVRLARTRSATLRIIVRTRYVSEVEALRAAGADEVIPEEFETSIEIVARILRVFHLPGNVVAAQIRLLRDEAYRRLRETSGRRDEGRRLAAFVEAGTTELFLVLPDTFADGRTLSSLELEHEHVTVPALLRDGKPFAPPDPELRVVAGDTLLLVGAHEDLARAISKLEMSSAVDRDRRIPGGGNA
jgi:CPA2 family monovalent cation:H+ antiporter-2